MPLLRAMKLFLTRRLSSLPRSERKTPPSQPIQSSVRAPTVTKRVAWMSAWTPWPMNESSMVGSAPAATVVKPKRQRPAAGAVTLAR